jgi:alpha-tubulin suppressor-like RCC1 family protein
MKCLAAGRSANRSPAIFIIAGLLAASALARADTPPTLIFSITPNSVPGGNFTPVSIALDTNGNLYVTDRSLHRVVKFGPNGGYLGQWGGSILSNPAGIAVDGSNNVYVADQNNNRLYKFNTTGTLLRQWGNYGSGPGQLNLPQGIALDNTTNLYVADEYNDRVEKFTTSGRYLAQLTGFYVPAGVAVDSSNNVYVLNYGNVEVFTSSGAPLTNWGDYGSAIAIDASNNVYVSGTAYFFGSPSIAKFTTDGTYLTEFGSPGGFGLAVDATGNFVYATDTNAGIAVFAYTAAGPPLIYSQPASQTVPAGVNVTFNAGVFGGLPLSYQWLFNGTNLPGETNLSLTLTNVSLAQSGTYALQVANDSGSVPSTNAFLVVEACFVTTQPPYVTSAASAQLNGMVTPGAQETTAWFEWGTNTSYGNVAGVTVVPAAGNSVRAVQGALSGLSADYVYHYRLVGSNVLGVTHGADQQFTVGRKVFGWGDNTYGQISVPGDWSNAVEIASGFFHSLALKNDRTVVAWGLNDLGMTNVPDGLSDAVAVAAGGYHNLALKNDGTIVAWGGDGSGGLTLPPAGLRDLVAVACGEFHGLALKSDGTVVAWGDNYAGAATVPAGLTNVVAVAGGSGFSLALRNNGTVAAWGDNFFGETSVPQGLSNVVAIAAGTGHCLALKAEGTVVAWGDNSHTQTRVPRLTNVVAIAAGGWNSLALGNDGTVVAWGDNSHGQRDVPPGLSGVVVGIAAGGGHGLALTPFIAPRVQTLAATGLTTDAATLNATVNPEGLGTIAYFRWGTTTDYGNVTPVTDDGSGSAPLNFNTLITGLAPDTVYHFQVVASNLVGMVFGADSSFRTAGAPYANTIPANGISTNGAMLNGMVSPNQFATVAWFEWGTDTNYGNVVGLASAPAGSGVVYLKSAITGLSPDDIYHYRLVASNVLGQVYGADQQFMLGRKVFAWGVYGCGQRSISIPPGLAGVVAVGGGSCHTLALKNDGTVAVWGVATAGQPNFGQLIVPPSLSNVVAVAAGYYHNLALKDDGTVVAWGSDGSGQTDIPAGLNNVVAIAAGAFHSLALRSDGTVVAWGYNNAGQGAVPPSLSNIVAIAGGGYSDLALRDDGTVIAWGEPLVTVPSVPPGLNNVVAIAAGQQHSLALRSDGTVVAWGQYPQARVPAGLNSVMAIAAGIVHSLAMKNDGTVVGWGDSYNDFGADLVPAGLSNLVVAIGAGGYQSLAVTPRTSPSAVTTPATDASASSVYLNATVNPDELDTIAWFRWGTTTNYGSVTAVTDLGSGSVDLSVSSLVTDLVSNTLYHCQVVSSNAFGTVFGADVSFTMSAPFVTTQPQSLSLYPGRTAVFSVAAGGIGPFAYQWMLDDSNVIAGATNSNYTLANVQLSDQGSYSCVITDPLGSVTSSNAMLVVVPIPNNGYVVRVVADKPIAYWRLGETNGTNAHDTWGGHDGQYTNVTLGVPGYNPSDPDTAIKVGPGPNSFVANIQGTDFSSSTAFSVECWVNAPPRSYYDYGDPGIVTKGTGNGGEQFDLDIGSTGYTRGYRWFVRDGSGSLLGAAGSSINPSNTWQHLVGVYDSAAKQQRLYVNGVLAGSSAVSGNGVLSTVHPVTIGSRQSATYGGPYDFNFNGRIDEVAIYPYALSTNQVQAHYSANINSQFESVLVVGGTTNVGHLSVFAGMDASFFAPANAGGPVSYQWYFNTDTPLPGATNALLALRDVQAANAGTYTVLMTGPGGSQSLSAALTVSPSAPLIVAPPASVSTIPGVDATFSVSVRGTEPLAYQWQFNDADIPGGTDAVLAVHGLTWGNAGNYRVIVRNSLASVPSDEATLALSQVMVWGDYGPTNVPPGLSNVVSIAAGVRHSLALYGDGTVVAWGDDSFGQRDVPPNLTNVAAIAAGYSHSLALKEDGTVTGWGDDSAGQIDAPTGLTNAVAIAAGWDHNLALKADGTVVAWGWDGSGEADVPPGLTNVIAVASGARHSLALKADGTVIAWGNDSDGQTNVPSDLTNVVAIAGGGADYFGGYSLALKTDGTVVAWGSAYCGETNVPPGLTNVIAIAAGYSHYLGLQADGTIVRWGCYGYAPIPSILTNVVAVAAGEGYSMALVGAAPWITAQPQAQAVVAGEAATIEFGVIGTPRPSYQWTFNGTNIVGATDATLILPGAQKSDQGNYSVVVSNRFGLMASSNAFLLVDRPPVADASATAPTVVSPNGTNATVVLDGSRTFSPDANPLQYLWLSTLNSQPSTVLATGAVAVVVLPVGTQSLLLVVSDFLVSRTNSITVEVITTAQAVGRLSGDVSAAVSRAQPLLASLGAAAAAVQRGDSIPGINQLLAFQNQVRAQVAPLNTAMAETLIRRGQAIVAALSSGNTNPSGRSHGLAIASMPRPEGRVGLQFSALPGQVFLVEASSNLLDWELIGVATDQGDGSFTFEDSAGSRFGTRFYRVVIPAAPSQ